MILTGVNNLEAFALGTTFGVGFEYTVGAGVLISTGCPFNEYNGILMFVRAYAIFLNFTPVLSRLPFCSSCLASTSYADARTLHSPHPFFLQATLGEVTFLGSGVYIGTGNPYAEYLSQASENGQVRRRIRKEGNT